MAEVEVGELLPLVVARCIVGILVHALCHMNVNVRLTEVSVAAHAWLTWPLSRHRYEHWKNRALWKDGDQSHFYFKSSTIEPFLQHDRCSSSRDYVGSQIRHPVVHTRTQKELAKLVLRSVRNISSRLYCHVAFTENYRASESLYKLRQINSQTEYSKRWQPKATLVNQKRAAPRRDAAVPTKHATPATLSLPAAPVLVVEEAFAEELVPEAEALAFTLEVIVLAFGLEVAPTADVLEDGPMGAVD